MCFTMRHVVKAALAFAFLLAFTALGRAAASGGEVIVLSIGGEINPIVSRYVTRSLERAAVDRAEVGGVMGQKVLNDTVA